MWEAIITEISAVDSSKSFEVRFDVLVDGVVKYPNQMVRGSTKAEILASGKVIIADLKAANTQALSLKVGDKFSV